MEDGNQPLGILAEARPAEGGVIIGLARFRAELAGPVGRLEGGLVVPEVVEGEGEAEAEFCLVGRGLDGAHPMVAGTGELAEGAQALGGDGPQGRVLGVGAQEEHAIGDGLLVSPFAKGHRGSKPGQSGAVGREGGKVGMLRAYRLELPQGLALAAGGQEEAGADPAYGGVAGRGGEGRLAVDDRLGYAAGLPQGLGFPEPDGRPLEAVVDGEAEELPRHVRVAARQEADAAGVDGVEVAPIDIPVMRGQGDGPLEAVDGGLRLSQLDHGRAQEGPGGRLARIRLDALAQGADRLGRAAAGEVGAAEEEEPGRGLASASEVAAKGLDGSALLPERVSGPAQIEEGFRHGVRPGEEEGEELGRLSIVALGAGRDRGVEELVGPWCRHEL